jgi:hypothetical protein
VRLNLEELTLRIIANEASGFEGDRIYSDEATDFFVTKDQKYLYLLSPTGDVIRLNTNHHNALSLVVQVTDWMSITKMGIFIVVAGWNNKSQENVFVLMDKELNYIQHTNISCKTSSRL